MPKRLKFLVNLSRSPVVLGLLGFSILLVSGCSSIPTQTPEPSITQPLPATASQTALPTQTQTPAPTATQTLTPTPTEPPYVVPEWFETAVIYEIFVRSFADSNGDEIGDFNGIIEKLDYIQSLHVNTIWLMPIYPTPSDHGYDVIDHFAVNPDFGTLEDLQNLVAEVHARDMHIIIDFVPSHLSFDNPLFQEAYRNPDSEYSDWFVFTNKNNTSYAGFADSTEMPRFNHYNPDVVQYLSDAALYWLDLDGDGDYTDGVDGFRVDNVTFPPTEFFQEWRKQIKAVNPEAVLLGESWVHTYRDLSIYLENQFDALFNFPFYELFQGNQNSNNDGVLAGRSMPILIKSLYTDLDKYMPQTGYLVQFLNNHDTNRISNELKQFEDREKLAATILATFPGPMMIYYGEEIGMPGEKGDYPYWDNYRREPMDWYTLEEGPYHAAWFMVEDRWNQPQDGISVEDEASDTASILNYYRTIFGIRQQHPAFQTGTIEFLSASVSASGPFAYIVTDESETFLVILNFSTEAQTISFEDNPAEVSVWLDLLSEQTIPTSSDAPFSFELDAGAFLILQAEQ